MKKLFTMAATLLTSAVMSAQPAAGTISIQPNAGFAVSSMSTDNTKSKIGFVGRVDVAYQLTDDIALSAGLGCAQYGAKVQGTDIKLNLGYITVPLMANYYVMQGLAVKTGLEVGINTSEKVKTNGVSADTNNANSVILGIPVGASYEYKNVVLDARFNIGVVDAYDNGASKPSAFVLTLGYKFDL